MKMMMMQVNKKYFFFSKFYSSINPTFLTKFFFLAWAEFNHRDEVIESGSTEATAMDTGNPWDSKPLAASTETPFDAPFCAANPTTEEGWADFANNKDSPAKSTTTNSKSEET